jgi:hypothetical protein
MMKKLLITRNGVRKKDGISYLSQVGVTGNGARIFIVTTQFGKKKFDSSMTFQNL